MQHEKQQEEKLNICHCAPYHTANQTRLSAEAAPALRGTGRAGVTGGGLVKAQTWFPPPLWKPGGWFKQNGVKTVQRFQREDKGGTIPLTYAYYIKNTQT